jgi:hypothetical protein
MTQAKRTTKDSGDAKKGIAWSRVPAFGVLPALALLLAMGPGSSAGPVTALTRPRKYALHFATQRGWEPT